MFLLTLTPVAAFIFVDDHVSELVEFAWYEGAYLGVDSVGDFGEIGRAEKTTEAGFCFPAGRKE